MCQCYAKHSKYAEIEKFGCELDSSWEEDDQDVKWRDRHRRMIVRMYMRRADHIRLMNLTINDHGTGKTKAGDEAG